MTRKEFEYICKNWDECIRIPNYMSDKLNKIPHTFELLPFELYLINGIKPNDDYFLSIPKSDFDNLRYNDDYKSSENKIEFLLKMIENGTIKIVKINYKKVQRIQGYTKGKWNVKRWKNNDWKSEVRNDKLKQLGL
mgnify:CR=1 FL=1|jgi:hypothetical protein